MGTNLQKVVKPTYKCLELQVFNCNDISVKPLSIGEVLKVKKWRNEQILILRQSKKISTLKQILYFFSEIYPERYREKPKLILFSIWLKNEIFAYGGLVHIDWHNARAELSFLHKKGEISKGYEEILRVFLLAISDFYSGQLLIKEVYTETFKFRKFHIQVLEDAGFLPMGREGNLKGLSTIFHSVQI